MSSGRFNNFYRILQKTPQKGHFVQIQSFQIFLVESFLVWRLLLWSLAGWEELARLLVQLYFRKIEKDIIFKITD